MNELDTKKRQPAEAHIPEPQGFSSIEAPTIWGHNLKTVDTIQLLTKSEYAILRTVIGPATLFTLVGGGSQHQDLKAIIHVAGQTYHLVRDVVYRTSFRLTVVDELTPVDLQGLYTNPHKAAETCVSYHSK
jgi:hypothetical protein